MRFSSASPAERAVSSKVRACANAAAARALERDQSAVERGPGGLLFLSWDKKCDTMLC